MRQLAFFREADSSREDNFQLHSLNEYGMHAEMIANITCALFGGPCSEQRAKIVYRIDADKNVFVKTHIYSRHKSEG